MRQKQWRLVEDEARRRSANGDSLRDIMESLNAHPGFDGASPRAWRMRFEKWKLRTSAVTRSHSQQQSNHGISQRRAGSFGSSAVPQVIVVVANSIEAAISELNKRSRQNLLKEKTGGPIINANGHTRQIQAEQSHLAAGEAQPDLAFLDYSLNTTGSHMTITSGPSGYQSINPSVPCPKAVDNVTEDDYVPPPIPSEQAQMLRRNMEGALLENPDPMTDDERFRKVYQYMLNIPPTAYIRLQRDNMSTAYMNPGSTLDQAFGNDSSIRQKRVSFLHYVAKQGSDHVLKRTISYLQNRNVALSVLQDHDKRTAVHYAIVAGRDTAVKCLLEADNGLKVAELNLLHYALDAGSSVKMFKALLNSGVPASQDCDGNDSITQAFLYDRRDVAEELWQHAYGSAMPVGNGTWK